MTSLFALFVAAATYALAAVLGTIALIVLTALFSHFGGSIPVHAG